MKGVAYRGQPKQWNFSEISPSSLLYSIVRSRRSQRSFVLWHLFRQIFGHSGISFPLVRVHCPACSVISAFDVKGDAMKGDSFLPPCRISWNMVRCHFTQFAKGFTQQDCWEWPRTHSCDIDFHLSLIKCESFMNERIKKCLVSEWLFHLVHRLRSTDYFSTSTTSDIEKVMLSNGAPRIFPNLLHSWRRAIFLIKKGRCKRAIMNWSLVSWTRRILVNLGERNFNL